MITKAKKGELTTTEIVGLILLLLFLIWALFFSKSVRGAIKDTLGTIFNLFR